MDAYMNKEQHIPEYQKYEKSAMKHTKEQEHVHTDRNYINLLSNSSSSLSSDDLLKNCRVTHLIQAQEKTHPNQCHHLINHPHFRINTGLIMKKYP